MNFRKSLITSSLLILLGITMSCSVKSSPIDYGGTACHYCSMTIVDKQHASQIVTDKGKAFNFDAIECMLNHVKEVEASTSIALYMVNDYNEPGELIDATQAAFLITEAIPSPMGAFLTAFKTSEAANQLLKQNGGEVFSWKELLAKTNESIGRLTPQ